MHEHSRRGSTAALSVVLAAFVLSLILMRTGFQSASGDAGAYLAHAQNLSSGAPYADAAFSPLYSPDNRVSPKHTYPPGFPIFLACLFSVFEADVEVAKHILWLLYLGSCLLLYFSIRDRIGHRPGLFVLGLCAFSPFMFEQREALQSEYLFMIFLYSWIYVETLRERGPQDSIIVAMSSGVLMFAAYETRTIAVAMFLALVGRDFVTFRRLRLTSLLAIGCALALVGAHKLLMPVVAEGGYVANYAGFLDRLGVLAILQKNASGFFWSLMKFWDNGHSEILQKGAFLVFLVLALSGFVAASLPKPRITEAVLACFAGIHFVTPTTSAWIRYLIPIVPLYFYYIVYSLEFSSRYMKREIHIPLVVAVTVLLGVSYVGAYVTTDRNDIAGYTSPRAKEAYVHLRSLSSQVTGVAFREPRHLVALEKLPGVRLPFFDFFKTINSNTDVWEYLTFARTSHILLRHAPAVSHRYGLNVWSDQDFIRRFVEPNGCHLELMMKNAEFALYAVKSHGSPAPACP